MTRRFFPLLEGLATGAWATPARLHAYAALLIGGYALGGVTLVLTGDGIFDVTGRLIGADFGMIWATGRSALAGRADEVFSLAAQAARQSALFGDGAGFTPWHYPPHVLLVAAPLAALPYLAALAVWQGATFALYLGAVRACVPPALTGAATLLAASFPAAFINAAHGQNGFLTAALATGGVLTLRARPLVAGLLFGALSFKPQFCALVPVLMLANGGWRAPGAAVVAAGALLGVTLVLFGPDVIPAFLASLPDAKRLTLETGATGWEKIQSVFAAIRLLGGGYELAMAAQIVVALATMAAVAWVWRSPADARLRHALVFPGVLLTTPYCIDYDMTLLAPALVLLAAHGRERGFLRWETSLLALVFVTPILARLAGSALHLPLGAAATALLFVWILRRARADAREAACTHPTGEVRTSPAPPLPSAS